MQVDVVTFMKWGSGTFKPVSASVNKQSVPLFKGSQYAASISRTNLVESDRRIRATRWVRGREGGEGGTTWDDQGRPGKT